MKSEEQIRAKIKEHQDHINALLEADRSEWTDIDIMCIESYLIGRRALQWVLSNKPLIEIDGFEKNAKWECTCFESGKIF